MGDTCFNKNFYHTYYDISKKQKKALYGITVEYINVKK